MLFGNSIESQNSLDIARLQRTLVDEVHSKNFIFFYRIKDTFYVLNFVSISTVCSCLEEHGAIKNSKRDFSVFDAS